MEVTNDLKDHLDNSNDVECWRCFKGKKKVKKVYKMKLLVYLNIKNHYSYAIKKLY